MIRIFVWECSPCHENIMWTYGVTEAHWTLTPAEMVRIHLRLPVKKILGGQQMGIIYLILKAYLVVCLATFIGFAFFILLSVFNSWTLGISDWKKNIHVIIPCFLLSFIPVFGQMTLFKLVGKYKI